MKTTRTRATTQTRLTIASALVDAPQAMQETCAALPAGVAGTIHSSLHHPGAVSLSLPWPDPRILGSRFGLNIGWQLKYIAKWPEERLGQLVMQSDADGKISLETHTYSRPAKLSFTSWRTRKLEKIAADLGMPEFGGVGCSGDGKTIIGHLSAEPDFFVTSTAQLFSVMSAAALLRLVKVARGTCTGQLRIGDTTELWVHLRDVGWDSLLSLCTTCDALSANSFTELGQFAGAMDATKVDELQVRISDKGITLSVGVEFDDSV